MRAFLLSTILALLGLCSPLLGQVKGPIVGTAERSDTSRPLRELAAEPEAAATAKPLDDSQKQVAAFLQKKHPAALERGQLITLKDSLLETVFPDLRFVVLRFRQWPVAFEVPEGLSASNVGIVAEDRVVIVTDAGSLEAFFRKQLPPADDETSQRQAVRAWLRLSQELHQDGFYRFLPVDPAIERKPGKTPVAVGTVEVVPEGGNAGQITVRLAFDAAGRLESAREKAELREGVRPICQATKLLDSDPLVRRMAERDLLVMGSICRDYLLEQRSQASPELQAAIDGVWEQIVKEGR